VLVDVGPVPAESARAWIAYARRVLDGGVLGGAPMEDELGPELVDSFRQFLAEWERIARRGGEFRWSIDIETDVAEYLVHAFHRIVTRLDDAASARGSALMPPEAQPFYAALVSGLLDGFTTEGETAAEFAEHLREFWPGLPE
jgi:hypothetical protein